MGKLKVFTAFSGYDSQCMSLDRLGIDYELVGWSEIDKYAIQAHNAVYPQWADRNFGDISKIDWNNVPYFDLFTYSFPCQDISNAGIQKGLEEGSGTRSSLLWECKKTIEIKRPKYLVMENVKALTQKKFLPFLHKWQELLESYGYTNYTEVLNAKNYGIPQKRERCFMISILSDEDYKFPKPFELKLRLKDVLEEDVDEKYYLSKRIIECFENRTRIAIEKGNGFRFKPTDGNVIANTITTRAGSRTDDNFIKQWYGNKRLQSLVDSGKVNGEDVQYLDAYNQSVNSEIAGTITTRVDASCATFISEPKKSEEDGYFIRKLTPRECFRLMGVSEENIDKIQNAGISNSQQYKMAGNSIVVDVLYYIFKELFYGEKKEIKKKPIQLTLF